MLDCTYVTLFKSEVFFAANLEYNAYILESNSVKKVYISRTLPIAVGTCGKKNFYFKIFVQKQMAKSELIVVKNFGNWEKNCDTNNNVILNKWFVV